MGQTREPGVHPRRKKAPRPGQARGLHPLPCGNKTYKLDRWVLLPPWGSWGVAFWGSEGGCTLDLSSLAPAHLCVPSVKPGVLLGAGTGVDCIPNRTQLLGSLCCNHNQHPRGTHQGVWETGLSTTRVPWASCLVRKAAASGVHHQPGSASWEAPDSLLVPGRWPVALRGRDVSPVWLSHTWHGG